MREIFPLFSLSPSFLSQFFPPSFSLHSFLPFSPFLLPSFSLSQFFSSFLNFSLPFSIPSFFPLSIPSFLLSQNNNNDDIITEIFTLYLHFECYLRREYICLYNFGDILMQLGCVCVCFQRHIYTHERADDWLTFFLL